MAKVKLLMMLTCVSLFVACADGEPKKPAVEAKIEVVDFMGDTVTLAQPAKRVVALAPHIVENIFSVGAGDQLVGAVEYSNFPPAANAIPKVGGYEKTNIEAIVTINPDLIIGWDTGNSHAALGRLRELGFTVYIDQPDSLHDVAKSLRDIGQLTGHADQAELVAGNYLDQLAAFESANSNKPKLSSFYQVWNSPLQTISGNHIISHTIEICGGTNIYADEFAVAPVINIESVLERDPEVIIASGMGDARPSWLDDWQQWPQLTAIKYNNLVFVNPDHIQRHTVRLLKGVESVCEQLDEARARLAAQ